MKRIGLLLVLLVACDKKTHDQPAPVAKPVEPGATVSPTPAPVPPPTAAAACPELRVVLGKDKLTHTRGDTAEVPFADGMIDPAALGAAFGARAQKCIGALVIAAADDVTYQDVVTVMDNAQLAGFTDIGLDEQTATPGASAPAAVAKDQLDKVAIITITPTEIAIAGKKIEFDAADLDAQLAAALEAAKAAGAPAGTVILQADRATSGKILNAAIRGAHKAGFGNVLFAIKKTP